MKFGGVAYLNLCPMGVVFLSGFIVRPVIVVNCRELMKNPFELTPFIADPKSGLVVLIASVSSFLIYGELNEGEMKEKYYDA